jgi:predicted transcriptional regulator
MKKPTTVHLDSDSNTKLSKISEVRRESGSLAWRKKDIIAELINKSYKRSFK